MKIENKRNGTQGITLVALSIIIVLLLILVGIGFYSGKKTIQKEELEELKTNMLLIQAKAREYVEEANHKIGIALDENEKQEKAKSVREEIYVNTEKLKKVENIPEQFKIEETDLDAWYYLTNETKEKWGLEKLENEEQYVIHFDETEGKVEVYYIKGYEGKYSLTDIDQIQK